MLARCPTGRYGEQCENRLPTRSSVVAHPNPLDTTKNNSSSSTTTTVCVLVILMLLVVAGVAFYWHKKRPFTFWKDKNGYVFFFNRAN